MIVTTAPEKEAEEIFAYVLEFMLTFDKIQNTCSPLMCSDSLESVDRYFCILDVLAQ